MSLYLLNKLNTIKLDSPISRVPKSIVFANISRSSWRSITGYAWTGITKLPDSLFTRRVS